MIRFALTNPTLFIFLRKIPVFRACFGFNMCTYTERLPPSVQLEIFASFYVFDGTTRQTSPSRFHDLDPVTVELLKDAPPGPLHDIGVSDGLTSLRLLELLHANGSDRPFMISDKYSRLMIVKGRIDRIYDRHGTMIAAYFGCFSGERCLPFFFVNRFLHSLWRRRYTGRSPSSRELCLWAPDVIKAMAAHELYELEYDVFNSQHHEQFAFVRCMNLLNRGYFNDGKIAAGIENIGTSLKENGLLLIGRTMPDGTNNASFFIKSQNELRLLKHINKGYEGATLVTKFKFMHVV